MHRWWLLLVLAGGALGCGSPVALPLHAFPSRAELRELAYATKPRTQPASAELSPAAWALELPVLASLNPAHPWLAALAPGAKPVPTLDCVAHELGRFLLQFPGRAPSLRLRQFISARCGSSLPAPRFVSLDGGRALAADPASRAALRIELAARSALAARIGGAALVRGEGREVVVVVYGVPEVAIAPLQRIVADAPALHLRGRMFETSGVHGYVNVGEHGVRNCEPDPAVVEPEFALRCELAPGDAFAWIQLTAARSGEARQRLVYSLIALRTSQAARVFQPGHAEQAPPEAAVAPAASLDRFATRARVFEAVNRARERAGVRPLVLAAQQSHVASSAALGFFATLRDETGIQAEDDASRLALGLLAGWEVQGGAIRVASLTASTSEALDPERWTREALEQPAGRAALLDPAARVFAFGSVERSDALAGLALTYTFFEPEPGPNAWVRRMLERLARLRKARGLGRTLLVPDASEMPRQLAAIGRGQVSPDDGLKAVVLETSKELRMPVSGFVWETSDFDALDLPRALLQKGDLTLAAGVTLYRVPGSAWGQYSALLVVTDREQEARANEVPETSDLEIVSITELSPHAKKRRNRSATVSGGQAPVGGDGLGIYTQPLGVAALAFKRVVYVPLGIELPVGPRADLVLQVSPVHGNWYHCGSKSSGAWASLGFAWFLDPRRALSRGWFIEPTLIGRYFSTVGGPTEPAGYVWSDCTEETLDNIEEADGELHLGANLGYGMRAGPFELAALVGVSAGYCANCIVEGAFFFGSAERFLSYGGFPVAPRRNRFSLSLNLNFLRAGARF